MTFILMTQGIITLGIIILIMTVNFWIMTLKVRLSIITLSIMRAT
jgi:hypothetical protein